MAKAKAMYVCSVCGAESSKWMGKCTACGEWNTLEEFIAQPDEHSKDAVYQASKPVEINEIEIDDMFRIDSGIAELNRTLGGGIVPGSMVLIGGEPGIGKSTLLLQLAANIAGSKRVLYMSAEESARQIKLRADRLGVKSKDLYVLNETNMEAIIRSAHELKPELMIIDSIQTVYSPLLRSSQGSVSQVRECASELLKYCKANSCTVFVVGHVTKEGAIAGPKVLEHIVDTVLYFEGEREHIYRILRSVKNRYGSTNEIGVFSMTDKGMEEVPDPNEIMLSSRSGHTSGSVVMCSVEGSRPVLVEIQALVCQTAFGMPRRMAAGVDYNRMSLLLAVLEKKVGIQLNNQDVYVSVAGGIRIDEPAADLALALAVASAYRGEPVDSFIACGEISLTGEVRSIGQINSRIKECAKMGFNKMIIPKRCMKDAMTPDGVQLFGVSNVYEALRASGLVK